MTARAIPDARRGSPIVHLFTKVLDALSGARTLASDEATLGLILNEEHQVFASQLQSFQNLGERSATILSVLTGFGSATIAIETVVSRPPVWVVALPTALLVSALWFAVQAFQPDAVWIGPDAASLVANQGETVEGLRAALIEFYADTIAKNRAGIEARAWRVTLATWLLVAALAALLVLGLFSYL